MNVKMFIRGIRCFFTGLCRFYSDISLMKYAVVPFILMSGCMLLLLTLVVGWASRLGGKIEAWISSLPAWISWAGKALSAAAVGGTVIISLVAAVVTILVFYETFAGPFFDSLICRYEKKYYDLDFAGVPLKRTFRFLWESLCYSINTLLISSFFLLVAFIVPVAGPCLLGIVAGYRLGVTYMLPAGFLRNRTVQEQLALLAGKKSMVSGFGITVYLLFLLPPFVSIFLLPGIILGGTELLHLIEDNSPQN